MKDIYTKTAKCVVWLGECPQGSLVDRALPQLPGLLQRLQRYPPQLGYHEGPFRQYGLPAPGSDISEGLSDLLLNEWFTRVWTFQESVLPKTLEILYGNHVISADHLGQLAAFLNALPDAGGLQYMSDYESNRRVNLIVGIRRVVMVATARHKRSSLIPIQYNFLDMIMNSTTWGVKKPCEYYQRQFAYT